MWNTCILTVFEKRGKKMEHESQNNWQNIGICLAFAIDKIEFKYQMTWMVLVRYSFGFGSLSTKRYTTKWWSNEIGISESTFIRHVKWLSKNKFIEVNTHVGFIQDGGSFPNSYSPCFPKGYGKIILHETKQRNKIKNNPNF
jgi:hypothetical protein